ncbi:MAG: leucyl/phenylalanyl-tRNA--protein transferase [Aureispira sp.]
MYWLSDELVFPDPKYAPEEGLLAAGGDLSPRRLLMAYEYGIFPWYNEGEPILWWSPDPRFVLYPKAVKVSKSMRRVLRSGAFELRFDTAFEEVLANCASIKRAGQDGTWLIPEMRKAYQKLHAYGYAHSVEAWQDGELVGGLYGVSLGRCFFGESMFAKVSNASKVALIGLAQQLDAHGFELIDCQSETKHLGTMGANFIERQVFLDFLEKNRTYPTQRGLWTNWTTAIQ